MPRAAAEKHHLYTFVSGLITEATGLTFPENALVAADNIDVSRTGVASRRLGVDYELNNELSSYAIDDNVLEFAGVSYHDWSSVDNNGSVNFFIIQVGDKLYVYNKSADPLSSGYLATIDISNYQIVVRGAGKVIITPEISLDSAVLNGKLFMVGPSTEPLVLEYDTVNEELLVSTITLRIRDFNGVDDGLAIDERPATLSAKKEYNLMNQGWVDTADSGLNPGVNTSGTGPSETTGTDWEVRERVTGVTL